jgi:hypothetical protein
VEHDAGMTPSVARRITTALGVTYAVAAVVNLLVTFPIGPDAYFPGGLADSTWFAPYLWVEEHLLAPNAVAFGLSLVAFQLLIAAHLLMKGQRAEDGLLVATVLVLLVCPAVALPIVVLNLMLATTQLWLWYTLQTERTGSAAVRVRPA